MFPNEKFLNIKSPLEENDHLELDNTAYEDRSQNTCA